MNLFNRKQRASEEAKQKFVEMIRLHGRIINKICYYYAADAEDFKDLRQDVLVNLWEGRGAFRGEAKESTWIYRVSLNTCISSFQKRKKKGCHIPVDSLINLEAEESSVLEQYRMLHEMIQKLSHREKAVILLWLDGADYETIAEVTGIGRNTVATLLRRAKEKLNKMANS